MSDTKSPHVIDVGEEDFEREVIERSKSVPVVVDFWAPWCAPCRMLGPVLEKLADQGGGDWILAKANVQDHPELGQAFQVQGIPAVKAFRDGKIVSGFEGALPERNVAQWLRGFVPGQADKIVAAAKALPAAQARAEYEKALASEPEHAAARAGLARILADAGDEAEALKLIDAIAVGGEIGEQTDGVRALIELRSHCRKGGGPQVCAAAAAGGSADGRFAHACCLAAGGDARAALEILLSLIESDRDAWLDKARKACVSVFALLGNKSELTQEYRDRLSQLLF